MTRVDLIALGALLLVSAGAAELDAAESAKQETPIAQVLSVRGGLSELTVYKPAGGSFEREGTVRADLLLKAGIDILKEEERGVLKARSGGTIYWLDRRELVTTGLHPKSDITICDPVESLSHSSHDLRSQGLSSNGCRQ